MDTINIYTRPELFTDIESAIESEHRLNELVSILPFENIHAQDKAIIIVDKDTIQTFPLWDNSKPALLLPEEIEYNTSNLLGVIFYILGNFEKSYLYLKDNQDLSDWLNLNLYLLQGKIVNESAFKGLANKANDNHTNNHNWAVANHYGNPDINFDQLSLLYLKALTCHTDPERLAYTTKQYATLLSDSNLFKQTIDVLKPFERNERLSLLASIDILAFISHIKVKLLVQPYDISLIEVIKQDLAECIEYFKLHELHLDQAFALMDTSHIALIEKNYSEALSQIEKTIALFQEEGLPELIANAELQKSDILFTCAQDGNPHFYRQAMKSCLDALEIFKRETAPNIFADIHHRLGIIYSEILDEEKKRGLWTAVSVASFKEALNYYNEIDFPYQYGVICNNQGNAYTKYPEALHSDNYAKALDWYNEALRVRDANHFRVERSASLLNYLEAAWNLSIEGDFDETLFDDMKLKAKEVIELNANEEFVSEANKHIKQLDQLVSNMKLS